MNPESFMQQLLLDVNSTVNRCLDIQERIVEFITIDEKRDFDSNDKIDSVVLNIGRIDLNKVESLVIQLDRELNVNKTEIHDSTIGSNAIIGSKIIGNVNIGNIKNPDSVNKNIQECLDQLKVAIQEIQKYLSQENQTEIIDDYNRLIEEIFKPKPQIKWWSVSIEGLKKAAENLGEVGKPILEIIQLLVPLLLAKTS